MTQVRRRAVRAVLVALAVATTCAGPVALAGSLPGAGVWFFDNTANVNTADGHAIFRAYLRIDPARPTTLYSFDATVFGAKCKKNGRTLVQPIALASKANKANVTVRPDGTFAATRKVTGDALHVYGTATVRGTFTGARLSGKVVAHLHNPIWGDCRGTGRFSRAQGKLIG